VSEAASKEQAAPSGAILDFHHPESESDLSIFTKLEKKNSKWTPDRVESLKAMWVSGVALADIAKELKVTPTAIYQARFRFDLPVRKQTPGRPSRAPTRPRKREAIKIERVAFETSRLMEFCTERELVNQTGHQRSDWPLVVLKELMDNALDAAEEAECAPEVEINVTSNDLGGGQIVISDNGPGILPKTVRGILDYTVRVSSREAYVSPTRGAQGNALKTILPMNYVMGGSAETLIEAHGIAHHIRFKVDRILLQPKIEHTQSDSEIRRGTRITINWPDRRKPYFNGYLDDRSGSLTHAVSAFCSLNPHLTCRMTWNDQALIEWNATNPNWAKWRPRDPTSPHWYNYERFERYMAAHVARDAKRKRVRTVREFVAEFRGMSSTIKQKTVLEEFGASHTTLSEFLGTSEQINTEQVGKLLESLKRHTEPVKAKHLGLIGEEHCRQVLDNLGCKMETFRYSKTTKEYEQIPWVIEMAFAIKEEALKAESAHRDLIQGINWSAALGSSPFRQLGTHGEGMDGVWRDLRAGPTEPIVLILHVACPRIEYLDRGKSAIVVR
jgi:DNA topoisomerase VI subunit B